MKGAIILSLALLSLHSVAASITLEQFWPWLSPNPLALGTSSADLKKIRPEAMDLSGDNLKSGGYDLVEQMPDGSLFNYSFFDDKFVAVGWGRPASSETPKLLLVVRNSILKTCGEPTFGTSGRLRTQGGVARIVWEQYRPHMDPDYLITLKANSESGIEVELVNEPDARKRGVRTDPYTYEETVQRLPSSVSKVDSSPALVDLLEEARSAKPAASPDAREPKRGEPGTSNSSVPQPSPEKPAGQKPAPTAPVGMASSPVRWPVLVIVILGCLGLLWIFLKKRK